MWAAASSYLIATHFKVTMEGVIHTLQVLLIVAPIIAYLITKRICLALQKKDREIALHGFESGRIVRLPGGEYIEVHEQLDDYERWKLVSFNDYKPLMVRPDAQGRITGRQRLRAAMSTWFFEDRIEPPTRTEVERSNALH
jgi:ubiquinol-cytochrome c reductase cytochrome b subunit